MVMDTKKVSLNPELSSGPETHSHPWPVAPWIVADLQPMVDHLKPGETIAEVGCMAGEYVRAVKGADILRVIIDMPRRASSVRQWPVSDATIDLLVSVDSLQYMEDLDVFCNESARIIRTTKLLVVVTPSPADLAQSGLAKYFPDTLQATTQLFPQIPILEKKLSDVGLHCLRRSALHGSVTIDNHILNLVKSRQIFGLTTLNDDEFAAGLERLRQAISEENTAWPVHSTVLVCRKVHPYSGTTLSAGEGMGSASAAGQMGMGKMGS